MTARDTMQAYTQRINNHAFDDLRELIAPDAVFWFSDGTSHVGIAELEAVFVRTWYALADETYWLDEMRWIAEGDLAAACTYRFNWKATMGGKPASGSGRGASILSRASGNWQIVHEHLSNKAS